MITDGAVRGAVPGDVEREAEDGVAERDAHGESVATDVVHVVAGVRDTRSREAVAAARRLAHSGAGSPALDLIAELAARLVGARSAQISVLSEVQTIAGGANLAEGAVGSEGAVVESLCTVTASSGVPVAIPDATADERVAGLPPVATGQVGAYLGVPLRAGDGNVVGALCVFDPSPRAWRPGDVEVLEQLSASVVAELELSALGRDLAASRTRWELAIEAAGIGSFDWDLVTGRLLWDDRLREIFGFQPDDDVERIEAFYERVHPDDAARVAQALRAAIEACGDYEAEYRVVVPDGTTRWVLARGRALCDERGAAVRLLGAAYDTTTAREGEARVARVLESIPTAFFSLDRDWRFTYVNAQAELLLGRDRGELLGGDVWQLFPLAVGTEFETQYRRAMETGEQASFEAHYPAPLDRWYEVRAWPAPDGLSVYFHDITARRAAQEGAERAAARSALLAEVASELAGTLDAEEAVARLARLVVPALADWCLVTLVTDEGRPLEGAVRDIGSWHHDPARRDVVERFAGCRLQATTAASYVMRVLATGRPEVLLEQAAERIAERFKPGVARDMLLRDLRPGYAAFLPIRASGRTLGLLSLFADEAPPDPDWTASTATEVAARAGLALDNARLYAQQRRLAEGLQRSMLTDPPEPDHLQIAVRYQPAAAAAQVGGDWYDAFLQPHGATVVVIGDVVGHDTEAAAAMGQVRSILRGIAVTSGERPAPVLSRLDEALELLRVDTTATAVVARLEQTPEERAAGDTRLLWSNAGHPPPVVIGPDGSVRVLGEVEGIEADLLLGIDRTTPRSGHEVVLPRGSTVLLYTDGLVERRGQSLDEGLDRLCATLEALAGRQLDDLCDELLSRMLADGAEDDVALAAVRLHREDQPRPEEAGPQVVPATVPRRDGA